MRPSDVSCKYSGLLVTPSFNSRLLDEDETLRFGLVNYTKFVTMLRDRMLGDCQSFQLVIALAILLAFCHHNAVDATHAPHGTYTIQQVNSQMCTFASIERAGQNGLVLLVAHLRQRLPTDENNKNTIAVYLCLGGSLLGCVNFVLTFYKRTPLTYIIVRASSGLRSTYCDTDCGSPS